MGGAWWEGHGGRLTGKIGGARWEEHGCEADSGGKAHVWVGRLM